MSMTYENAEGYRKSAAAELGIDITPRWRSASECDHANNNVCPMCDFDRYYAATYPECPWAGKN